MFWKCDIINKQIWVLRGSEQNLKGSPVNPSGHMHKGVWLTTLHNAWGAQLPGHGLVHWLLEHTLVGMQSVFKVHSGRQFGGKPM